MNCCLWRKKIKRAKTTTTLLEILHEGLFTVTSYGVVAELLCNGADPFVEHKGYNAFEWSIQNAYEAPLQELLFNYTFDHHFCTKIHLNVLVQLLKTKSPLFHQILGYNIEVVLDEIHLLAEYSCGYIHDKFIFTRHFLDFFNLDINCLKILIEKCNSAVCVLFRTIFPSSIDFNWVFREIFSVEKYLMKLSLILDGGSKMKKLVIECISGLDSYAVFVFIKGQGEDATSELLLFLMMYGLKLSPYAYYAVYRRFGYCNLFKILLHMEPGTNRNQYQEYQFERNGIFSLIFNINLDLDLEHYFDVERNCCFDYIEEVMDYFAHPELERYIEQYLVSEKAKRRIKEHPKIPLLVEISRNVLREYLIKHHRITNSRQFYTIIDHLPVSSIHKKIITYETKLY